MALDFNLNVFLSALCLSIDLNYLIAIFIIMCVYNFNFYWLWCLISALWCGGIFVDTIFIATPTTLMNGLFNWHPVCVMAVYICLLVQILTRTRRVFYFYCSVGDDFGIVSFKTVILVLLVCAVYLGGWWANQELGWGGWWSWDVVEMVLWWWLWVFIVSLHGNVFYTLDCGNWVWGFYCVVVLHLLVRSDLTNSIHSFLSGREYFEIYWFIIVGLWLYFNVSTVYSRVYSIKNILMWVYRNFLYALGCLLFFGIYGITTIPFNVLWVGFLWIVVGLCLLISNKWRWWWWVLCVSDLCWWLIGFYYLFIKYELFVIHCLVIVVVVGELVGLYYDYGVFITEINNFFNMDLFVCGLSMCDGWGYTTFVHLRNVWNVGLANFFDVDGIYNFVSLSSYCGGVYVLEDVISLWQWGGELWFYIVVIVTCVLGRRVFM